MVLPRVSDTGRYRHSLCLPVLRGDRRSLMKPATKRDAVLPWQIGTVSKGRRWGSKRNARLLQDVPAVSVSLCILLENLRILVISSTPTPCHVFTPRKRTPGGPPWEGPGETVTDAWVLRGEEGSSTGGDGSAASPASAASGAE